MLPTRDGTGTRTQLFPVSLGSHVPLIVTADVLLAEELVRLCAAAAVVPIVASTPGQALARWREAPMVLLGADLRHTIDQVPRRNGRTHLVLLGSASEEELRWAMDAGGGRVVELPSAAPWLVQSLGDLRDDDQAPPGPVVAFVGGSGGAGASVLATAVAQSAARHQNAVLVDLDPHGPGIHQVVGLDRQPEVGWEALAQGNGRVAATDLRDALPAQGSCRVLTWQGVPDVLATSTICDVIDAGARGHALVVLDLDRGWAVPDEVIARIDLVVVVIRPDVAGLASGGRTVMSWSGPPVVVVVRGPGARAALVRDVAGAPVLARMGDQRGLREALDLGFGPLRRRRGPLNRAVRRVLECSGVVP